MMGRFDGHVGNVSAAGFADTTTITEPNCGFPESD
jgi:hypothetical protein